MTQIVSIPNQGLFVQRRLWKRALYYGSNLGTIVTWLYRDSDSKQGHLNALDLFQGIGGVLLSFMLRAIFPI